MLVTRIVATVSDVIIIIFSVIFIPFMYVCGKTNDAAKNTEFMDARGLDRYTKYVSVVVLFL